MKRSLNILVVDDDKMMVKTISDILDVNGFTCLNAYSATDALELMSTNEINCVITDIKMPAMNGAELFREIKRIQPDLPVVLMTAFANNDLVEQVISEGALSVLYKPIDINLLLNFLNSLKREPALMIVDDDHQFCKTMFDVLKRRNFNVEYYTDILEPAERLWKDGEILILDLNLNGTTGYDLMKKIRLKYPFLPVILVTGHRDEYKSTIDMAISESAFTCLFKPIDVNEFISTIKKLIRYELRKKLGSASNTKG